MLSRTAVCLSGVAGGLCWIARYLLATTDVIAADGAVGTFLKWAGLVWVLIALVGAGVGLVRRGPLWLRGVVGVAVPVLGLVVLSLLYGAMDRLVAEALFGGGVLVASLLLLGNPRGRTPVQPG